MRVIPVIDLKRGVAVHAVRGDRERYRPLRSRIAEGSDPVAVTRAVRDRFGLDELYVADLDAIAGEGGHPDVVAALAREARVLVDAGVAPPGAVAALLDLGAARVVIGTESLPEVAAFAALRAALPEAPLVVSLDLRGGRVLSPDPALAGAGPAGALARLADAGADEAIVLDLARVGSGEGPDVGLIAELRAAVPGIALLAGGGVRDAADLRALAEAGAVGALVATALHGGAIAPDELRALDSGPRTMTSDPEWRYVNVRRLLVYLEHSIDTSTQWAVFEPNGPPLWSSVRQAIEDFLLEEWKNGALVGRKPEEAYFVRCDRTTMTQNDLDNGRLVCLIGIAPVRPAEFVMFRIGQWTADSKLR